jgi:hypothetical protein
MTAIYGDRNGMPIIGTLKTVNISPPPVRETYLSSNPIILPTTLPAFGSGQVSFTVLDGDIQRMSPMPTYYQICPVIHVAGKIGTTASTVSVNLGWNGTQSAVSATSASVGSGNYWTASIVSSLAFNSPVKVGDTFEVRINASQTDVKLDYYAITCYLARCSWGKNGQLIKDLFYDFSTPSWHTLTLGVNPVGLNNNPAMSMGPGIGSVSMTYSASSTMYTFPVAVMNQPTLPTGTNSFGLLAPYFGDVGLRNSVTFNTHGLNHPYYQRNSYPSKITYRELLR